MIRDTSERMTDGRYIVDLFPARYTAGWVGLVWMADSRGGYMAQYIGAKTAAQVRERAIAYIAFCKMGKA